MIAALLVAAAVVLVVVAPRVIARWTSLRRAPRAALVLWQAIALSGVVCVLAAPPVAFVRVAPWRSDGLQSAVALGSLALSGLVLSQLIINAHVIGSRLRTARREQRTLVDLVGDHRPDGMRVITHESLRAYCVPGLRQRVVVTDRTLSTLDEEELAAVLAHERAHLRARHDLVLELFTVLHRATPAPIRAPQALHEVRLLVEVLADRSARRECGEVPVGRALIALAAATSPAGALGLGTIEGPRPTIPVTTPSLSPASITAVRVRLLVAPDLPGWLRATLYAGAAAVVAMPSVVIATAWLV